MKVHRILVCLVVLCSAVALMHVHAQEVTVFQAGVSPTAAYDHLGQTIFGGTYTSHANVLVGYHTASVLLTMRGVLAFDLNDLPADAAIQSIQLALKTPSPGGSGSKAGVGDVDLYELQPGGSLANELNGDVTWTDYRTDTPWTSAGGDFGTKLQTVANADLGYSTGQTTVFGTSAAFVTAAQGAYDGGRPLQMILQAPTAEGNAAVSNYMRLGRPTAATPGDRPELTVTYVVVASPGTVVHVR